MKYKVVFEGYSTTEREPIHQANYGLRLYDGNDNEYTINLNNLGELEISSVDGKLSIMPNVSNVINITTV